jgi:predicted nucleic acid-binding protein
MASRREPFALYLDTSALVKLFVDEAGSGRVRALAGGRAGADILLASRLGLTEASVSFARMVRLGRLSAGFFPPTLGRSKGTGTNPSRQWS